MARLLTLLAVVTITAGCLRERFRREARDAAQPERAPALAAPVAQPRPPQPPPLPSEPVAPQPPALPDPKPAASATPPEPPNPVEQPKALAVSAPSGGDVAAVRALAAAGRRRLENIPSFECRLTKREVVNGAKLPQDEIAYRLRTRPFSVFMRVLSESGKGRELLYVEGQNGGKIAVLTGQGDSRIVGVGYRTDLAPDSRQATSKSRYKITEAGFARTLAGLDRAASSAEAGRGAVKSLGLVNRPETTYALEGVAVTLTPGLDPLLPRGGTRRVYFDPKPDSPSYQLPIVIETFDAANQEVEYYAFAGLVVPCPAPESAWDAARLGK